MYKLLIADDERIIRKGLRNVLDWESLNIEVTDEAEDGEIALEIAERAKPDLMLLDICMPFLNGLELIKRLEAVTPNCIIIIITGHDEFEYMHEAIKLKVFDYILKPVIKDSLQQVIFKAIKELDNLKTEKKYMEWANKQIDENLSVLQQSFFYDWFNGRLTQEQILSNLHFFKINIKDNTGIMLIKAADKMNYEVLVNSWSRDLLNFAIINITNEVLKGFEPVLTYVDEDKNILVMTNINAVCEWLEVSREIEDNVLNYLHLTIVMEQRLIMNGIEEVKKVYEEMQGEINETIRFKPVVLMAVKYINSNYYINDFCLDMVSDKLNVSPSYLSRLLKQDLGLSFIDYLTKLRINKAICLMSDPKIKIYEIAEAVGYSNQHYFCKAFKKVMGFSPIEYRRRA